MKWKRPGGSIIETNDAKATIEHCKAQGWEEMEADNSADSDMDTEMADAKQDDEPEATAFRFKKRGRKPKKG